MFSNETEKTVTVNVSSSNNIIKDEKPTFVQPPEAPVFYPNEEEFQNPLVYIAKIRRIAEPVGICKIKPPSQWRPPFAVDVDNFKFTPRIQKLNELDATTRTKLNFLEKIAKFWEMQGSPLKIPLIKGKPIDLCTLYNIVHRKGGFIIVSRLEKWLIVAKMMGYYAEKTIGIQLKTHYERLLYPIDLFNEQNQNVSGNEITNINFDNVLPKRKLRTHPKKASKYHTFYFEDKREVKDRAKKKMKYDLGNQDPLDKYICNNCNRGDEEECMLLCEGCDDGYHTFCLLPPLQTVPEGDWYCPKCVAEECSKPMDAFGFEQALREYSLQQFGEMADKFKTDYFKMPINDVSTNTVEKEYWRIISALEEDVTVEYGADLHAMDHGSGFPTKSSKNLCPGDREYAESPWNLNNLPILQDSVLHFTTSDLSGITVPWMYVGMCFATFCWHSEDHWTYSINYLHWGEAKTWYAVPGSKAELFEAAMKSAAPELFTSQPDLLHQLVTIINPNVLMSSGVPVHRTDQNAGEFVITFPRAYHAGFNQGYNFAEAVNFAPADWLKIGRKCVLHYAKLKRFCVFSHDEVVCKMAANCEKLTVGDAKYCYHDMRLLVETEQQHRKNITDWGVKKSKLVYFESKSDDERQCEVCKTTCYLSAISCKCSPSILVCLRHCRRLCGCSVTKKTLQFRYSPEELTTMLRRLKLRAEAYDEWVARVTTALDPKSSKKMYLTDLKAFWSQAIRKMFPKDDLFQNLNDFINKAEKFARIINQLRVYEETSGSKHNKQTRITLNELKVFEEEIKTLPCLLEETKSLEELLHQAELFEKTSVLLLAEPLHVNQLAFLESCSKLGRSLGLELPNMKDLITRLNQLQWLQEVKKFKSVAHVMTMQKIKSLVQDGEQLKSDPILEEELTFLKNLLKRSKCWQKRVSNILQSKSNNVLSLANELFQEASEIPCFLPMESILYEAVENAKEWLKLLNDINSTQNYPCFGTVEDLVKKGKELSIHLPEVQEMNSKLQLAISWKQKLFGLFLEESTTLTIFEALFPRTAKGQFSENFSDNKIETTAIVQVFKESAVSEFQMMKKLRESNLAKSTNFFQHSFCLCAKKPNGLMIECQLCKDWFHPECVNSGRTQNKQDIAKDITKFNSSNLKLLCPNCKRTKRPSNDDVFNILLTLRDIQVRLMEGEVLHCLTERALEWQAKVRIILADLQSRFSWEGENIVVSIDSLLRRNIEDILMEGDLIEISLEESMDLWNILNAVDQLQNRSPIIDFNLPKKSTNPIYLNLNDHIPKNVGKQIDNNDIIDLSDLDNVLNNQEIIEETEIQFGSSNNSSLALEVIDITPEDISTVDSQETNEGNLNVEGGHHIITKTSDIALRDEIVRINSEEIGNFLHNLEEGNHGEFNEMQNETVQNELTIHSGMNEIIWISDEF